MERLTDADRVESFLDPAIRFNSSGYVTGNDEQLLINTMGSRVNRPPAATAIPNFFVASDYVSTETDLACMEAANEAARQAVNAVLVAAKSTQAPCEIHPLEEPALFRGFQQADEFEYQSDPGRPPLLCRLVDLLLPDSQPAPAISGSLARDAWTDGAECGDAHRGPVPTVHQLIPGWVHEKFQTFARAVVRDRPHRGGRIRQPYRRRLEDSVAGWEGAGVQLCRPFGSV